MGATQPQPCPVANRCTHENDAGAVGMLEPQNYSRGGESARAAQVAHSSEQAAHAQASPRDTCCPFWLHPAQRRLQRRDLTRAPLPCTNKYMEGCGHSLDRARTHTLNSDSLLLLLSLPLLPSPSCSRDRFSLSLSRSLLSLDHTRVHTRTRETYTCHKP